jgi:hypothetical protein
LSTVLTWGVFEAAVIAVFREALDRLSRLGTLPRAEEPINLELYWLLRQAHFDLLKANTKGMLQFVIYFDTTSQPQPDDVARSQRLRKRPDFSCTFMNPQALDFLSSQIAYYIECKRLGNPVGTWILNENYSEHGIGRFTNAWQYAKGFASAAMVGYMENSTPATILNEVNAGAANRGFPLLARVAAAWAAAGVNLISQPALTRPFLPNPFVLTHLWVDLSGSTFVTPTNTPPVSASAPVSSQPATPIKKPKKPRKPKKSSIRRKRQ